MAEVRKRIVAISFTSVVFVRDLGADCSGHLCVYIILCGSRSGVSRFGGWRRHAVPTSAIHVNVNVVPLRARLADNSTLDFA